MVLIAVFAIKRQVDSSPCETKNVLSLGGPMLKTRQDRGVLSAKGRDRMEILTFLSHMPLQEKKGPESENAVRYFHFGGQESRVGHQDLQRYIHS